MFVKRLISGIILIAVIGGTFAFGGYPLAILLTLISMVGYAELHITNLAQNPHL